MNIKSANFESLLNEWPAHKVSDLIYNRTAADVEKALAKNNRNIFDLAALLSPAGDECLENLARHSQALTRQRFGNTIQFYVPLYVSNYCVNSCVYCGFNCKNQVNRQRLTIDEAVAEAEYLAKEGFQHFLLVSGEDPKAVPVEYFAKLIGRIQHLFASINIEIYPMSQNEYAQLVAAGLDSLTVYQETYDQKTYKQVHPAGPKHDFKYRLATVERGARAGITFLGIGALLGLTDWRVEAFHTAMHARFLQQNFWRQHVSVSFPRFQHAAGEFTPPFDVSDRNLVQIITAMRLFLPDAGLVLSTRESKSFRDHVIPLGITRISAGSKTTPGGYAEQVEAEPQFDVQDTRNLKEMMTKVTELGFDPVRKDWDEAYHCENA
jgi:2-iminoacetate synthase